MSRWISLFIVVRFLVPISGLIAGEGGPVPGIQTLYVVEFSHSDVGFNAPPTVMQERNHDRTVLALNLADTYPSYRWTIETTYQLENFLDRASQVDRQRLIDRLAEGRFAYGANYTNMRTGYVGEEEYHRLVYPAARIARTLGIMPRAAFLNDVPGFTMATPRVLAGSGIPFAVLGPNGTFGGKPDIPLQDRPFWWESRDGSRVLTWITYGSYAEGYVEWGLLNLGTMETKIPTRVQEFEDAGYAYDAVLVIRAFDDHMPNSSLLTLASQWNAIHEIPKIQIATAEEFFDHIQMTYGDVFPTYRGDASGPWEDVTTVTPVSTARVRGARSDLPDIEGMWAMLSILGGLPYPAHALSTAWDLSMIFDEHSGGGMGWPGLLTEEEVRQENREFVAIAQQCAVLTETQKIRALETAGPQFVPSGESGLVLFNPLGSAFDGIVEVDFGLPQPADLKLAHPTGGPAPVFRWTRTDRSALAFQAYVPANGWARWKIDSGGNAPPPPGWSPGDRITAGTHELVVDSTNGTGISLTENPGGFNWLASSDGRSLAGIERGKNIGIFWGFSSPFDPEPVTVLVEDPSPLFRRIRVLDGRGELIREYTLYEEELQVDVRIFLRRSALPFVPFEEHSHHYAVTFPADLTPPTELRIDGPDGSYKPGAESLPGAGLSHFGQSTGASLIGAQGNWICVTSRDAPIVDLGEMNGAAASQIETDETTLTFKLIRHSDVGQVLGGDLVEFEAEPGTPDIIPYRFRLRFGDINTPLSDDEAMRRDLTPPLIAWITEGAANGIVDPEGTLISIEGSAQLVCMKLSERGDGLILRLRADSKGGTAIVTPPFLVTSAEITNIVEEPISPLPVNNVSVPVPLVPDGVVTVLLRD